MNAIKTVALSVTKYDQHLCDRFDAFVKRHWIGFLVGFLMGFGSLAIWNMIMRWVTV